MWICAVCGTEAQQPEICSGCGSRMRPFGEPPKPPKYQFVLVITRPDQKGFDVFGPFPTVMAGDNWAHANVDHHNYEVVLMESPEREPS